MARQNKTKAAIESLCSSINRNTPDNEFCSVVSEKGGYNIKYVVKGSTRTIAEGFTPTETYYTLAGMSEMAKLRKPKSKKK